MKNIRITMLLAMNKKKSASDAVNPRAGKRKLARLSPLLSLKKF